MSPYHFTSVSAFIVQYLAKLLMWLLSAYQRVAVVTRLSAFMSCRIVLLYYCTDMTRVRPFLKVHSSVPAYLYFWISYTRFFVFILPSRFLLEQLFFICSKWGFSLVTSHESHTSAVRMYPKKCSTTWARNKMLSVNGSEYLTSSPFRNLFLLLLICKVWR